MNWSSEHVSANFRIIRNGRRSVMQSLPIDVNNESVTNYHDDICTRARFWLANSAARPTSMSQVIGLNYCIVCVMQPPMRFHGSVRFPINFACNLSHLDSWASKFLQPNRKLVDRFLGCSLANDVISLAVTIEFATTKDPKI